MDLCWPCTCEVKADFIVRFAAVKRILYLSCMAHILMFLCLKTQTLLFYLSVGFDSVSWVSTGLLSSLRLCFMWCEQSEQKAISHVSWLTLDKYVWFFIYIIEATAEKWQNDTFNKQSQPVLNWTPHKLQAFYIFCSYRSRMPDHKDFFLQRREFLTWILKCLWVFSVSTIHGRDGTWFRRMSLQGILTQLWAAEVDQIVFFLTHRWP